MSDALSLSRADRRLLWSGASILLLMVCAAALLLEPPKSADADPSSRATGSGGAKAAYLLLEASGYRVARWEQPPGELTDPPRTTLILSEPSVLPSERERADLRQFIERGGRVIATGTIGAFVFGGQIEPDPISRLTWTPALAAAPAAITRAAPFITLAADGSWASETFALPLYVHGDDRAPVVVAVPFVGGDAYWWAASTPLSNAGLRAPGNLEFFLASVGPPAGRRVLFDEYFHGARPTLAGSIWHSPVRWVAIQLAVCAAAVLWTFARRSGPVVPPAAESRLSPLEFVRTLGSLYQRAGAASVAVDVASRRFRFWLGRRLGVPGVLPLDSLGPALRARWPAETDPVMATLAACEAAREDATLSPRTALALVRALGDHTMRLGLLRMSFKESL